MSEHLDLATWHPWAGFQAAAAQHPQATALEIGSDSWTYADLGDLAGRIAQVLLTLPDRERVAVLASRSLTTYAGSLAVFAAGAAHVALNPSHPPARNAAILRKAGVRTLIVGPEGWPLVAELAQLVGQPLQVLAPLQALPATCDGVLQARDERDVAQAAPVTYLPAQADEDLAYLVFTSGSTGEPKGVAIQHHNLAVYMRNFRALAAPLASDRVAQTYELTFDVALHDMFNAWWSGACLVVMPERAMLAPARFIRDQGITYWFSVASFAMILQRQNLLKPGVFPLLRVSMLCGEALPKASATAWSAAAPHSVLYNVYGPTETTMELAFYRWEPGVSEAHCKRGVAPIGIPFDGHRHLLLDDQGQVIEGPGEGELYLSGPQVGPGYWGDEARTQASFVSLPGQTGRWYRTGDRIERDEHGIYHFISRVDFQVKLRGNRIELGEVEAALREATGVDLVAVLAHPVVDGVAQSLVACVPAGPGMDSDRLRRALAERLPKAMVPDRICVLDDLPLNANRKIDRGALTQLLDRA